jgi:hypothetical protein
MYVKRKIEAPSRIIFAVEKKKYYLFNFQKISCA